MTHVRLKLKFASRRAGKCKTTFHNYFFGFRAFFPTHSSNAFYEIASCNLKKVMMTKNRNSKSGRSKANFYLKAHFCLIDFNK